MSVPARPEGGHVVIAVSNAARSKAFYAALLGALGYRACFDEVQGGRRVVGLGHAVHGVMRIDTWLVEAGRPPPRRQRVAWRVGSRREAALIAGAVDPDGHHLGARVASRRGPAPTRSLRALWPR